MGAPATVVTNIWGNGGPTVTGYPHDWASDETKANGPSPHWRSPGSYKMGGRMSDILGHKDWGRGFVFAANAGTEYAANWAPTLVRTTARRMQRFWCWWQPRTTKRCVRHLEPGR